RPSQVGPPGYFQLADLSTRAGTVDANGKAAVLGLDIIAVNAEGALLVQTYKGGILNVAVDDSGTRQDATLEAQGVEGGQRSPVHRGPSPYLGIAPGPKAAAPQAHVTVVGERGNRHPGRGARQPKTAVVV